MSSRDRTKLPCGRPAPVRPTQAHAWKERLEAHLLANQLKKSETRQRIAEVAASQSGHFTIQDIARRVQETHPGIGTATVYRSFPVLLDAGVLKQALDQEGGEALFEWDDGLGHDHHDHLVCLDCDAIFEFHEPEIESIQSAVTRKMKFREEKHRHVIYGRCQFLERIDKKSPGGR